jgi:hypothetical protein
VDLLELAGMIAALVEEVEPDVEAVRARFERIGDVGWDGGANVPFRQYALQERRRHPLHDPIGAQVAALAEPILQIGRAVVAQHLADQRLTSAAALGALAVALRAPSSAPSATPSSFNSLSIPHSFSDTSIYPSLVSKRMAGGAPARDNWASVP